jgi:NAD(P)-dependent dehydrogenase (short-subunit alcohol dehydrogenase family)
VNLTDKVVLVTGANGGLGASVTKSFLNAGASVIGVARSIAAPAESNPRFVAKPVELRTAEDSKAVVEDILKKFGKIDGLVHLIGGFSGGVPIAETEDAMFDRMIAMNLRSAFHLFRAVVPQMRSQGFGRIAAIGSKAALEPSPMAGVYAASKAALVSLVRTLARENSDRGISVNVLLPGTMDTPSNREGQPGADFSKWIDTHQVAELLVHLMSDQGSQINGAVIPIYGMEA